MVFKSLGEKYIDVVLWFCCMKLIVGVLLQLRVWLYSTAFWVRILAPPNSYLFSFSEGPRVTVAASLGLLNPNFCPAYSDMFITSLDQFRIPGFQLLLSHSLSQKLRPLSVEGHCTDFWDHRGTHLQDHSSAWLTLLGWDHVISTFT